MKITTLILLLTFVAYGCTNSNSNTNVDKETERLQAENISLKSIVNENKTDMKQKIATSLTFQENNAEQAMNFYVELFDNSKIIDVQHWGKDGPGKEGTIMAATFELSGNKFICSDSPPVHNWTFTPAVSIYVECEDEGEIEKLFSKLSENGNVAMPLDNYGFSQKFGWVEDKFGVWWQLNLE